jgi:polygalacturonase
LDGLPERAAERVDSSLPSLHPALHDHTILYSHANGSSVFDVRDFGATGDGTTLDTEAIAKAIRAAAAAGTLVFRSGVYRTGTFELLSNVTLYERSDSSLRSFC